MKTQKQRIFSILAILTMTVILTCIFAACDKTNVDDEKHTKQVPVYKGMTISDSFAGTSASVASDDNGNHYGHFKGDHNNRNDEVDQNKPFEDPNAPSIENKANSTLDVVGAAESIYYADKNQDIFITIRLSNPDSYEILSFTLNGKKYSNYMFEEGSDMENLVLKVNVGNVGGIHDYTIDAIKYVDGTDIKDVRMDGDRTVKAGVRASDQTYVNVTNEQKSMTSISFDAQVVDLYSLIEKSGGYAKAVLYDGVNITSKDITVGEKTSVTFDNLTPNTVYQYGVVALYDNLSGNGAKLNTLYKKAVYTDTIVLFKDVQVGKESIEWGFVWNESFASKQMSAISLWQNGAKVQDVDVTATRLDGLKTDNEYTLKATYNNLQNQEETISIEFVTCAKAVPTVEIANVQSTQTEIAFELNVTDTDNVGAIAKIELLHGEDAPIVVENTDRTFVNLLSNNDYTIKVTYAYDLNDGVGEQQIVKTADIKTKAKAAPMVEIVNVQSTQTEVSFELNVTDTDDVGAISRIKLLHGDDEPILASDLTSRSFGRLLSNNDYTIQVTYVYDLNDGVGEQTLTDTVEFRTEAKATPTVTISDVDSTQTSVGFVINVTDTDSVGAISKIELLHGNDEPIVADTSDVRTFENLLSNNDYTVKVAYTYDLNDGVGEQQIVKTADVKTKAKAVPTVEITNVVPTQTSVDFAINVTDTDNVGAIAKIELLHGEDAPIVASDLTSRSFENLLSNNDYTIKVTYTYDLNDGVGEQQIVKTADFKTLEKATPSVEIDNWTNTQNKLSADVTYTDVDVVGRIESVVLFKGETQVATTNERTHVVFDALEGDTEYTLVITYKYDLNDGKGEQTATQIAKRYTAPQFEFVEATCVNTSAVSNGDVIYFEAKVVNPSGVAIERIKINDKYYTPSSGTTKTSIIVNITVEDQFEGGNTALEVTEIQGTLHGQIVSVFPLQNNVANVFVNGELSVKSIQIVDEDGKECDMAVYSKQYFYIVSFNNKTGYSIDSVRISNISSEDGSSNRTYSLSCGDYTMQDAETAKIPVVFYMGWTSASVEKVYYSTSLGEKSKEIAGVETSVLCIANEVPVVISTAEQLKNMDDWGYYVLENDLDFAGTEWKDPANFRGYFDGQGYAIKNMNFVGTVENTEFNWGLFNNANGVVKNLTLSGRLIVTMNRTNTTTYNAYVGGLCATAYDLNIESVANNANLSVTNNCDGYIHASGLVGYGSSNGTVTITDSYNTGSVSASTTGNYSYVYAGGLVGGGTGTITGSYNTGSVSATSTATSSTGVGKADAYAYAGGLVGDGTVTITDSYNTGSVSATSTATSSSGVDYAYAYAHAGGLVGCGHIITLTDSYNAGAISATSSGACAYAGGVVGVMSGPSALLTMTNCYNIGMVSSSAPNGVSGLIVENYGILTISNSYYTLSENSNSNYGEKKDSVAEIVAIIKELWDSSVWDFDNLDEKGNPTLK